MSTLFVILIHISTYSNDVNINSYYHFPLNRPTLLGTHLVTGKHGGR